MQNAADIRARLEATYREIAETRMDGVPIMNRALDVAAVGFEPFGAYHLGVMLTPWFMNLMLLPQDAEAYAEGAPRVGDKLTLALPAGQVEFIIGYEESMGHSLSCSLFSPVFEFAQQEVAVETAEAALKEILNPEAETSDEDPDMTNVWAGKLPKSEPDAQQPVQDAPRTGPPKDLSRRDLFRGGRAREEATAENAP